MSGGVSVVICCHNSAKRLPETLRHLAVQEVPPPIPWEIIVVNNASTDDTAETAARCWPDTSPAVMRVISEPRAGLSSARIRGIREAHYEIVSFIDDDNWVAADWVKRVDAIFALHPEVGALGGSIEAVCEVTPPDWFESVQVHYAVGRQHEQSGDITDTPGTLLCGAGLSVRTDAVKRLLNDGFDFRMSDRKGSLVSSGGDTELCFALRASGWRFWYEDNLKLRHFIPQGRLQWDYALRLMRGMGESSPLFDLYLFALNVPSLGNYPTWKRTWLFQMLKIVPHFSGLILAHPLYCLRLPEGSTVALRFQGIIGQLAMLWSLRGRYKTVQETIRRSAWVKTDRVEG